MAVEITSSEELEAWLEDKPGGWATTLAIRTALRGAHLVFDPETYGPTTYDGDFSIPVFPVGRALVTAMAMYWTSVPDTAILGAQRGEVEYGATDGKPAFAALKALNLSSADEVISHAVEAITRSADVASMYPHIAERPTKEIWKQIAFDAAFMERTAGGREILSAALWSTKPNWFAASWKRVATWFSTSDEGFEIWREWYYGRIEGLPHAFADFDDAADQKFYRWIVEQDDDWWKREPAEVNAEITQFVDALRKPKTPAPDDQQLVQNPLVGTYIIDEDGRSAPAPEPLPNGLSDDPDTRDAFDEIRRLATDGVAASDPLRTQAPEFGRPASLLVDACGETLEGVSPVKFVLRGKALVRKVEGRIDGSLMGPPLSEEQEEALAPLAEAIKLAVRTEPKLFELWSGDFDVAKPVLTTQQINIAIEIAGEANQTVEEADADLKDAASVIPDGAGEDNAERKTASEKVTNFFRSIAKPFKWADGILTPTDKALKIGARLSKHWPKLAETFQNNPLIKWIIELFTSGS